MKTKQITTRWLGLALACGAITLANPAFGKKPAQPPPRRRRRLRDSPSRSWMQATSAVMGGPKFTP